MNRQIVLDTETTGLDPKQGHRIIEIGCIELINRRITSRNYHVYINPQREIELGAAEVHGITNDFLQDKPLFIDIVDALLEFIDGAELIIHNAPFDLGFINSELKLLKQGHKKIDSVCSVIDTLQMARKMHPGQRNSLDALCKRYDIDNSNRNLHGALIDAELLAQTYLAMTSGQNSLFSDAASETQQDSTNMVNVPTENNEILQYELSVVLATDEELAQHHAFLESMAEKNKNVLWLED